MSPQEPQERGNTSSPAAGPGRSLRDIPGFTVAVVAFVMIVILGIGGIAVANWSQTATVTMGVTAGAAITTSPPATTNPPPTTTPPPSAPTNQVNVVTPSKNAARPASASRVECSLFNGLAGKINFSWSGPTGTGLSYAVSLRSQTSSGAYDRTQAAVAAKSAMFDLGTKASAFGNYQLRIQPMKDGVAGDPLYWILRYDGSNNFGCYDNGQTGLSPLGGFTVTLVNDQSAAKPFTVLDVSWTAAQHAKLYTVSIQSKKLNYGVEFTTGLRDGTFTFPPTTAAYGEYMLRIQPMNGKVAGDPVYRTVLYGDNTMTSW